MGFDVRKKLSINQVPSHVPYDYQGYVKIGNRYHPIYKQQAVKINPDMTQEFNDVAQSLKNNNYKVRTFDAGDGSIGLTADGKNLSIHDIFSDYNIGSLNGRGVMYDAMIDRARWTNPINLLNTHWTWNINRPTMIGFNSFTEE